jgi:hypothetical protein
MTGACGLFSMMVIEFTGLQARGGFLGRLTFWGLRLIALSVAALISNWLVFGRVARVYDKLLALFEILLACCFCFLLEITASDIKKAFKNGDNFDLDESTNTPLACFSVIFSWYGFQIIVLIVCYLQGW